MPVPFWKLKREMNQFTQDLEDENTIKKADTLLPKKFGKISIHSSTLFHISSKKRVVRFYLYSESRYDNGNNQRNPPRNKKSRKAYNDKWKRYF